MELSTTIIIGAMARMGMVCDVIIHGIKDLSKTREWMMPTAKIIPSTVPNTKPSIVADKVIHA